MLGMNPVACSAEWRGIWSLSGVSSRLWQSKRALDKVKPSQPVKYVEKIGGCRSSTAKLLLVIDFLTYFARVLSTGALPRSYINLPRVCHTWR